MPPNFSYRFNLLSPTQKQLNFTENIHSFVNYFRHGKMVRIKQLRELSDYLVEQKEYERAFYVYSEIYDQFWNAIAKIQAGINDFSREFLGNTVRASLEFKRNFHLSAVNSTFIREFDLDIDEALNEYIFLSFGRLQSAIYSEKFLHTLSSQVIIEEFLTLYNLLLKAVNENWISILLKNYTPIHDKGRIKSVIPRIKEQDAKKMILELSPKLQQLEWRILNTLLLDYLVITQQNKSRFFGSLKKIVGNYSFGYQKNYYRSEKKKGNSYRKYERYEKYEEYNFGGSEEKKTEEEIHPELMNEEYKAIYYGKVLGLKGKITKKEIRKQYLKMIALYHPDKVADLGKELIELAERKTKEINAAYQWLKKKYNI